MKSIQSLLLGIGHVGLLLSPLFSSIWLLGRFFHFGQHRVYQEEYTSLWLHFSINAVLITLLLAYIIFVYKKTVQLGCLFAIAVLSCVLSVVISAESLSQLLRTAVDSLHV